MKNDSKYMIHETLYQKLKEAKAKGWGGESFELRMEGWDATIEELKSNKLFPRPPSRLLELGSGAGDLTQKFSDMGYLCSGIEISQTAVHWAREKSLRSPSTHFYQGSVCDLNMFQNQTFDIVIDGNCLHCVLGADRGAVLAEVYRVLVPDGVFFVSTMIGNPKSLDSGIRFDSKSRCQLKDGMPYRYMGLLDEVLSELRMSGFEILNPKISTNVWWEHLTCLAIKK